MRGREGPDRNRPDWAKPLAPIAEWLTSVDDLLGGHCGGDSECDEYEELEEYEERDDYHEHDECDRLLEAYSVIALTNERNVDGRSGAATVPYVSPKWLHSKTFHSAFAPLPRIPDLFRARESLVLARRHFTALFDANSEVTRADAESIANGWRGFPWSLVLGELFGWHGTASRAGDEQTCDAVTLPGGIRLYTTEHRSHARARRRGLEVLAAYRGPDPSWADRQMFDLFRETNGAAFGRRVSGEIRLGDTLARWRTAEGFVGEGLRVRVGR